MTARLLRIPQLLAVAMWPQVERDIVAAMSVSKEDTVESLKAELLTGAAQLWIATIDGMYVGVVITEIQGYSQKKVLEVRYLAGERLREWIHLQSVLDEWAAENGCVALRLSGRKGWLRFLGPRGWRAAAYQMERAVV